MQIHEVVVIASVVGMAVGLLIVPTVQGVRSLVTKMTMLWRARRAMNTAKAGKRKPKTKQQKKKASVLVNAVASDPLKRRGRPSNNVKMAAESVSKINMTAVSTKRRGRPSNAEIARRAAEAAKAAPQTSSPHADNSGVHAQIHELNAKQLAELAVMPDTQQAAQATETTGAEPI